MAKKLELGQMLVDDGLITKEQLQEAIYNQVIFGGKLGTNILEFGYIDEETLARYLARQHRVKTVRLSDLAGINPALIKIISKRVAEKYKAIPLRLDGKKLYMVMANPSEMGAISELSFTTGKIIVPLVLPEVRIYDLLNQYYGLGRELRYINIAMLEAERRQKRQTRPIAKISPVKKSPAALKKDEVTEAFREKITSGKSGELQSEKEFEQMTAGLYQKSETAEQAPQEPQAAPEPIPAPKKQAPPLDVPELKPVPAPVSAPASVSTPKAPPKTAPPEQPYRPVAHAIYQELVKAGIDKEVPAIRLKDFLKSYVMNELHDFLLPLKGLALFLLYEVGERKDKVAFIIENIAGLESVLGVRFVRPAAELLAQEAPGEKAAEAAVPEEPEAEVVELEEVLELEPSQEEPEITYLPEPEEIQEEVVEEPEPEIPQFSFAEATKELMEKTKDRDDLAKAVIGFAKGFFKRSVLFTVREDRIFGWMGAGTGIRVKQVQQMLITLSEPSVFKTVVECSCHFLGPLLPQPENLRFLAAMGGAKPNSVFLIPIIWQQKVVYVLYGDNGDGQNVPFDIGELLILAQRLPTAIQRLIEEKKKQYQVIQGGRQ